MKLFESGFIKRVAIGKIIGLLVWWIGFLMMPLVITEPDLFLRIGFLLWYVTLGAIIWFIGVMDKYPVFSFPISFWIRGAFLGAWMNFILVFFMYDKMILLMQNTIFASYSPFCFVLEWLVFWLIVDFIATKYAGEGKKILDEIR